MRLLVTGASGFVGRHLLRALAERGDVSVHAAHGGEGTPAWAAEEAPGAAWLSLDLTSGASVEEAVRRARPDAAIHLAAQSSVGGSFRDPLGTWEVNATGTLRLLRALGAGRRVLVAGSSEVYGAAPPEEQPLREEAPLRPASPYAASKAAAEAVALQMVRAGESHAIVTRSFNHTGPGQDARFALPSFARQLAEVAAGRGEPALRVGNLSPRRDFLDVRDVARAYLVLLDRGEAGGVYNVCSGEAHALRELVETMVALSGTEARIEVDPARVRPVDLPLLVGDASRLRALGWAPEIPLRRTLEDLLAAEREAADA